MTTVEPAALSVKNAAIYLGISRTTLYKISAEAGQGRLPVVYIEGKRLYLKSDLDAYLARNRRSSAKHRHTAA